MYNNYEYDNYGYNYNNQKNKFSLKNLTLKGKLVLGGVLLVLLIIGLIVFNNIKNYYNSYEYFEIQMVEKAQEYVKNNNMLITDEIYIDMSKLNMEVKNTCSQISGVLVDEKYNYQAYLLCEEYETNFLNNDSTYDSLNGKEVMLLAKGINYVELGVKNTDEYNVQGTIGTEEGVYDLNYIVTTNGAITSTLKRKVIIVDNAYIQSLFPTFTLLGEKIEYVEKGHQYIDKGVVASDKLDLDITNQVEKHGKVDTTKPGEYDITYSVTNSRGYSNSITRKVVVVNSFSTTVVTATLSKKTLTNQDVIIALSVNGYNYDYMILPNGNKTSEKIVQYIAPENGIYNFFTYDKDGKSLTKIVIIENIDKTPPKGTCIAEVYPTYADITVKQTSDKKISGYNYIVNGIKSDYKTTSTYKATVNNATSISVQIKDSINNTATISCEMKYMDPTIGNNNVKYYTAFGSEYVIPKTQNDLDAFLKRTKNKISQNADIPNCGDSCLSFSRYHAYVLQYGNMNSMTLEEACGWGYSGKLYTTYTGTDATAKQEALKLVYNEIFAGRVIVLQITGTSAKNSRHFGVVVGYRRKVYNANDLREEDLIYIDAWNGGLRTLDPAIDSGRIMFNEPSRGGWRVDRFK